MNKTVLVVDDSQLFQTVLSTVIKATGFDVVTCKDGAEAIPLLTKEHERFAAVVLDIYMPLIDGISTLGHIRSNWPDLPVVIISGTDDEKDEASARQLGAAGVINKSVSHDELKQSLRDILSDLKSKAA